MRHPVRLLCVLLLSGCVLAVVPATAVHAQQGKGSAQQQSGLTAQEAAAKARARYGGKVLKVTRKGDGYQVRLLQDSGRVVTVTIRE